MDCDDGLQAYECLHGIDTEEVTGSNPVSPTSTEAMSHRRTWPFYASE